MLQLTSRFKAASACTSLGTARLVPRRATCCRAAPVPQKATIPEPLTFDASRRQFGMLERILSTSRRGDVAAAAIAQPSCSSPLVMQADARVLLVCGALLCLGGSLTSVYVAVTHDPNRKADRPAMQLGEYVAGASVVGACALVFIIMRK
mmetsp:Transcript_64351/g.162003  ORF Transcript_64351/g.162003 Transcript_64351/m.162003 type:complete len:150 (+) Transcript_64351:54-503(+)